MALNVLNVSTIEISFRNAEIDKYLNDIRQYKALDRDEEMTIAYAAQNGDNKAKQSLINHNLLFVVSVAKKYQGCGLDLMDLINEGNIGLCKAADLFDITLGNRFVSFAVAHIRQHIIDAINDKGRLVRLPLHVIKEGGVTSAISMDAPIESDSDNAKTFGDTFASDSRANNYDHEQTIKTKLNYLLSALSERDREIVVRLFGIGCTEQSEYTLSKRFDLTEERIRQIKVAALEKMRNY